MEQSVYRLCSVTEGGRRDSGELSKGRSRLYDRNEIQRYSREIRYHYQHGQKLEEKVRIG